ncbi:hypothetical protein CPB86DRAFT_796441 [Serendipita vermifera]|nr:hypothetical protein CPB86DRAFT_796441 [Serendipita vermifera]
MSHHKFMNHFFFHLFLYGPIDMQCLQARKVPLPNQLSLQLPSQITKEYTQELQSWKYKPFICDGRLDRKRVEVQVHQSGQMELKFGGRELKCSLDYIIDSLELHLQYYLEDRGIIIVMLFSNHVCLFGTHLEACKHPKDFGGWHMTSIPAPSGHLSNQLGALCTEPTQTICERWIKAPSPVYKLEVLNYCLGVDMIGVICLTVAIKEKQIVNQI